MKNLVKFSSQIEPTLFALIKEIAKQQSRSLQDIFNEAVKDYIAKVQTDKTRPNVMKALKCSLLRHDILYKKLAR